MAYARTCKIKKNLPLVRHLNPNAPVRLYVSLSNDKSLMQNVVFSIRNAVVGI